MTRQITFSVAIISLLSVAAEFHQQKPELTQLNLAGDPRCANTFGIDSCDISSYDGTVNSVVDGETLSIAIRPIGDKRNTERTRIVKLRIASITVPKRNTPLGNEAKTNLAKLTLGKDVLVIFFCAAKTATIYCSGLDIGLEQIHAGLARYDDSKSDTQEYIRCNYRFAEEAAKAKRLGVWQSTR